jgi:hypothetical protein
MTQNEIIELAIQAEILAKGDEWVFDISNALALTVNQKQLEAFAKLVAEREREECAKLCDDETRCEECGHIILHANLIRARGQE